MVEFTQLGICNKAFSLPYYCSIKSYVNGLPSINRTGVAKVKEFYRYKR